MPSLKRERGTMTENWGLLGHEWAVDMLRQHIARDAMRHAYLFAGPPHLGRRTLALRFAQAMNCTEASEAGIPCGKCRDCRQIEAMQHPDLAVIEAEHEGGILKVEQVRETRRNLALKPYQSKYRLAIFLRFQEANDNAANALLKTLEEAPAYAVLILTADNPDQLLPTIVSRCEVLRLRPLPVETVESFLLERGVDSTQARLLAHISGGRPGYALHLWQDPGSLAFRTEKLSELQSLLAATRVEKFEYAEKLARDKEQLRQVLLLWLSYWRDVLLRAAGASAPLANIDLAQNIEALAGRMDLSQARRMVTDLEKAITRLEASVNPRLLAEVLLLGWPSL